MSSIIAVEESSVDLYCDASRKLYFWYAHVGCEEAFPSRTPEIYDTLNSERYNLTRKQMSSMNTQFQGSKAVPGTFYRLQAEDIDGNMLDFASFENKVVLIVNVASK